MTINLKIQILLGLIASIITVFGAPFKHYENETDHNEGVMSKILEVNKELSQLPFEGDIILADANNKNAIIDPKLKWKNEISYEIGAEYKFEHKDLIEDVLREITTRTCLTFKPKNGSGPFLKYKRNGGCSSAVGMNGGAQIVSIDSGCESRGIIMHETLHALGFWHEQSRYDRDEYVKIMWNNIIDGHEYNFNKYSEEEIQTLGAKYDYSSVMHYDAYSFSKNGEATIVALKDGAENMGQRKNMSNIDWWKLRTLYECETDIEAMNLWSNWTSWSRCDESCIKYRRRFQEKEPYETETEYATCELCIERTDEDCNSRVSLLVDQASILKSPLYPYNYKDSADCIHRILVDEGDTIVLDFEFIDIERHEGGYCFDYLEVYDGTVEDWYIGSYCGTDLPSPIVSSGNLMTVVFKSDSSVPKLGYFAKVYSRATIHLVHVCYFEGGLEGCHWFDDSTADYGWSLQAGKTESSSTGPNFDHTTEETKGRYIYMEGSSPYTENMKARAVSPFFPSYSLDEVHCLNFWYMMYGENIGTLNLYLVNDKATEKKLFSDSGNQGKVWLEASISYVTNTTYYYIVLEGVRGNGYKSDIAVDDMIITRGECE